MSAAPNLHALQNFPVEVPEGTTPGEERRIVQQAMRDRYPNQFWRFRGVMCRMNDAGVPEPLNVLQYRALAADAVVRRKNRTQANGAPVIESMPERVLSDSFHHPDAAPFLRGVVHCPYVTADGRWVTTHGYDEDTEWFLWWTGEPADPDSVDDEAEADVICRLTDVEFEDEADKIHLIALHLQTVRLTEGYASPAGLITATENTSAKTLVASNIARIKQGREPTIQTLPTGSELKYTLGATLRADPGIVVWDNAATDSKVGSPELDAVLTSTGAIASRIVGSSDMGVGDPTRIQWIVTGNSLDLAEETARRVVPVRLVPRSKGRPFRTDNLSAWVLEDRRLIVSVFLRIVRRWHLAECPEPPRVLPSFERWSRLVGGPVALLSGGDQFLADTHRPLSADHRDMALLCDAWTREEGKIVALRSELVLAIADQLDLPTVDHVLRGASKPKERQTRLGIWLAGWSKRRLPVAGWFMRRRQVDGRSVYWPERAPSPTSTERPSSKDKEDTTNTGPSGPSGLKEDEGSGSVEGEAKGAQPSEGAGNVPHVHYVHGAGEEPPQRDEDVGSEGPPEVHSIPESLGERPVHEDIAGRWILEMAARGLRVDAKKWRDNYLAGIDDLATLEGNEHRKREENLRLYGPAVHATASLRRVTAEWYLQGPGRWSCRRPYLHEVTKRFHIRDAVVPERRHRLIIGDWNASHLWMAAGLSGDEALLADLEAGKAYDRAADVWTIERPDLSVAKVAALSALNGAGGATLAKHLTEGAGRTVTAGQANGRRREWFARYPQLSEYLVEVQKHRTWTSPLGRTVEVPPEREPHKFASWRWQAAESDALRLVLQRVTYPCIFTFYDEAILEVSERVADAAESQLRTVMDASLREVLGLKDGDPHRTTKVGQHHAWSKELR